ncbi:MAG: riboflavin biosynthesis protein RibF [Prevotellaceae bacterium]|nr:riboflavin biosynthesis protein RibF [Prevotellaceae bacterium]
MKIILNDTDCNGISPSVATIGFFDGVHLGHRFLIRNLIETASKEEGMTSMVITFDEHPRLVLHKEFQPRLLTTKEEKTILLSKTGIDSCAMLHFDTDMAALSAYDFMKSILREKLNVRKLIIGYDNRFGHNREEGFDDYVRYGKELGIEVIKAEPFVLGGVNVSSSVVRAFLSEGEVEMAERCLGYPYFVSGRVVSGFQEGRKMGFPTANVEVNDNMKIIPCPGVYAVKVRLEGTVGFKHGMMNIGTRPTFGDNNITLEVNIFNFEDDIYGQHIDVMFSHRLRKEQKFTSVGKLIEQLKEDRELAERLFEDDIDLQ